MVLSNKVGYQYSVKVKLYSPLLAKINILKYGSNKLRTKQLHYQWKGLSRTQYLQPIVKGKALTGEKPREDYVRKKLIKKLKKKGIDTTPYEAEAADGSGDTKTPEQRSSVLDEITID